MWLAMSSIEIVTQMLYAILLLRYLLVISIIFPMLIRGAKQAQKIIVQVE